MKQNIAASRVPFIEVCIYNLSQLATLLILTTTFGSLELDTLLDSLTGAWLSDWYPLTSLNTQE